MTGISDLPRLEILPVEHLVLHEYHDDQRTPPLITRLRTSGVLRNPPIVLPLEDLGHHYMVLDGANRVSAFRMAGISHIVAQVVQADDPNLDLNSWNHVVWGIQPDELYRSLRKIPGVVLQPGSREMAFRDLMDIHSLASLHLPDGKVFTAFTVTVDLIDRIKAMNGVVACYKERARVDRTMVYQVDQLADLYPDLSGLVMLPTFEIEEIMDLVRAGFMMPPGSTRFTISPRVLHLNYPLNELMAAKTTREKNIDLQNWIQSRLARKKVRYYAEATFLFDE